MENFEMRMNPTSISTTEDGKMYCEGLVNGTETWSHEMGIHRKFVEKIKKGVFTRAIEKAPRIDFLAEHDSTKLLASTENGSLELFEDSEGLKMRAEICPTSYGKDMYELMKAGMVRHMSFGFKSLKDKWEKRSTGLYERTIEDMKLVEVSVVRNPAYAMSGISARNIELIEDVEIPAEVDEVKEETVLQEKEERALTVEQLQSAINVLSEYMDSLKEPEAPQEEKVEEVVEDERSEASEEVEKVEVTEEKVEEQPEKVAEEVKEEAEVVEEQPKAEEPVIEEQSATEEVKEEIVEQVEEVQEEKTEDSVNEEVATEEVATENKEETVEEIKVEEEQPSFDLSKYRELIKEDIVL